MKKSIILCLIGLLLCAATCCTTLAIFDSDSDITTNPDGRRVLEDTNALWDEFQIVVDDEIRNELSGKSAPGGRTWSQRWLASIENLRNGNRENYQRYIDYIIETRRRHGLPELTGGRGQ